MPSKPSSTRKPKETDLPTPGAFNERQPWSRDDHRILRQYYPTEGAAWVARKLGRTMEAVKIKASRIGLIYKEGRKLQKWTKKEHLYISRNYHKKDIAEMAEALGRSVGSVVAQAEHLRRKARKDPHFPYPIRPRPSLSTWNKDDIRLLHKNYGVIPTAELAVRLGRSPSMVRSMASTLGIVYPHARSSGKMRRSGSEAVRSPDESLPRQHKKFILNNMARLEHTEIADRLHLPPDVVLAFARRNGYNDVVIPKRWTRDDVALLRKNFSILPLRDIAAMLGRSAEATWNKAQKLGLHEETPAMRQWTEEENGILRRLHEDHTVWEIAAQLGRTVGSIEAHAARIGLRLVRMANRAREFTWSPEQDALLCSLFGTMSYRNMEPLLKHNADSIEHRAAMLGLTSPKRNSGIAPRRWTDDEDRILRDGYRRLFAYELAEQLHRSPDSVKSRMSYLGLLPQRKMPNRPYRQTWTDEEDRTLRQFFDTRSPEDLSAKLGRSSSAIVARARRLGLVPERSRQAPRRPWLPEEDEVVQREFRRIPDRELAAKLGRTVKAVRERGTRFGMTESKPRKIPARRWTPEEEATLRELFRRTPVKELAERFGRTEASVSGHAKEMGLERKRTFSFPSKLWTEDEDAMLRTLYHQIPAREIAERLNRTKAAVHARARDLGVSQKRK